MTNPSIEDEEEIVLKVLHTADWHLGKRFGSFPEADAMKLTRARLEVLDSIFGIAERNLVDAVLCAGDLFDDPFPGKDWWQPLTDMLGKLAWKNRPMFMLPGNHDPLVAESVWSSGHAFRRALPSFVHVIDRDDFTYSFGETAILYAVPCLSKAGQKDPSDAIPCREPGDTRIRIGMMHGSTFDMEEHQTNFPIGEDSAVRRGLDYLAIGDTHGFRYVPSNRKVPPTIYPGAPEPTAFDEKEPGHVAVVNFTRRREAKVHPERVAAWTWEDVTVKSLAELQALRDRKDLGKRCLQLHVEMRLVPAEYERAEALLRDLQGTSAMIGRAGILVLDRAKMELDTTDMETLVAGWPEVLVRTANLIKADREAEPRVMQQALYKLYELSPEALMYFVRLKVDGLRAIESADVELGRGLNVLYGPNDIGKSTLAAALRAALLLPPQSSEGQKLVPWHRRDQAPRTVLHFVDDQDHRWRVRKTFGDSPSAELEASKDDLSFSPECSGREVEEKLRSLLGWGIPGPGGKGTPRGLPHSFLTQVLLAEQTDVRAILAESLEEDKEGSGKLRLTAALKTLAQDPLFKKVLDGAQAGYDVYFSGKSGQAKRGKNAPRVKMAEEIKKRSDELADLTKRREESKSAEARVFALRAEHVALRETAAEAEAEVEQALTLRGKAREHEALTARLMAARSRLGEIDLELAAIEDRNRAVEALRAEAGRRAAALTEAGDASELAGRAERDAAEALRQASSDDAARARELQRAQIEGQRLALQAKIADAEGRRTRARAATDAIEAAAQAEAQHTSALAALSVKRHTLAEARAALVKVEEHLRLTKGLWAYGRWRDAMNAANESHVAAAGAAGCRAEADALGAEVAALEARLGALWVPTEAEARAVVALRRAKDLAEAALGGGISVVVVPKRSLTLRTARDGAWQEAAATSATVEIEAEGKLELQVEDLVDIRVTAGDAARRKAAEALQQRWLLEGEPILGRAGVADVASLEAHVKGAGDLARRIDAARRESAALHDKANGREARVAELEPTVRSLREREEALTGLDRATLELRYLELGRHWEPSVKALEAKQEDALAVARGDVATRDREAAGLEEGGKHAEAHRGAAIAARDAALAQVGSDPAELARSASAEIDAARKEGELLDGSLARIIAGGTVEVERARRAQEDAQRAVKAAEAARVEALEQATEARSRADRAAGEIAMLRERGATLDRAGAAAAARSAEAEVAAFGPVDGLPTDADVAKAQAVAAERRALLVETTRALDAADGALEQVGGATLQDALDEARRARDNCAEQERELEVTAKSWQLLRDKLQQAEEAEGAHLGRALGAPVAERLGELTEGRYGMLTLGPSLKTENIEVRGGGSPEDALSFLSVGTLEQLATLVRVAVAEHLRSAIVLDDHLVQSDRGRLEWFRRMLRRTATHTQLLVLTCRPEDYLEASEIPGEGEATREVAGGVVRAINLAKVIRRWHPSAAQA